MIPFHFRKARFSRFFLCLRSLTLRRNRQNGNRFYDVRSRRLFLIRLPDRAAVQRDGYLSPSPFLLLSSSDEFLWREHLIKDFLDSWVSVLLNSIAITFFLATISSLSPLVWLHLFPTTLLILLRARRRRRCLRAVVVVVAQTWHGKLWLYVSRKRKRNARKIVGWLSPVSKSRLVARKDFCWLEILSFNGPHIYFPVDCTDRPAWRRQKRFRKKS